MKGIIELTDTKSILVGLLLVGLLVLQGFSQTASNGFYLRTITSGAELAEDGTSVLGGMDLDGDGLGEFIVFSLDIDQELKIFEATSDNVYALVSSFDLAEDVVSSEPNLMAFGNVDGDSDPEILIAYFTADSEYVRIFDVDASTLTITEHPNSPAPAPADNPFAVGLMGDTDGDGNPEFVVCNVAETNGLQAYEWNGAGWDIISQINSGPSNVDLAVGDTDGDGKKEIAVVSPSGLRIFKLENGVLSSDGTVLNNFSSFFPQQKVDIGDVDQNGTLEIVITSQGVVVDDTGMFIFENTGGTTYDRDAKTSTGIHALLVAAGDLEIGDYDNDGYSEIYWSEMNGMKTLKYIEFNGVPGVFIPTNFSDEVTIFNTEGNDIFAFDYVEGQPFMMDQDYFRDIAIITQNSDSGVEVFVIESGTEDPSLPVTLASFTARSGDREVILEWVTESEINNEAFMLERSRDGEHFTLLAEIPGQGNKNHRTEYQYVDRTVRNGITYFYRLADRDLNGHVTYHQTVSVIPGSEATIDRLEIYPAYPNPFNGVVTVKFSLPPGQNESRQLQIKIYDNTGRLVRTLYDGRMKAGIHALFWNATDQQGSPVASGTYLLHFRSGNFQQVQKIVLVK